MIAFFVAVQISGLLSVPASAVGTLDVKIDTKIDDIPIEIKPQIDITPIEKWPIKPIPINPSDDFKAIPIKPLPIIDIKPKPELPEKIDNPKGTVRWEHRFDANINFSLTASADGVIYFDTLDLKLHAINPDGREKWNIVLEGKSQGIPAIGADGTIYMSTFDHKLYAFAPDGSTKWVFQRGGSNRIEQLRRSYNSSPTVGADGTIFVGGSDDTNLYAINPDGTKKWEYTTGGVVNTPSVGADGTIYVGSDDSNLYAVKPNGQKKWIFHTNGTIKNSGLAIGADGTIYVGSYDSVLYAINPDGSKKWSQNYEVGSSPTVGKDGTIYVGSRKKLLAVNPNGTIKWKLDGGDGMYTTPLIGADGTIYVTHREVCYAINPDGTVKWEFDGASVGIDLAVGIDGSVYMGSNSVWQKSILYALGTVASSITVNKKAFALQVGESETLAATIIPEEAPNKRVRWSSSDSRIAAVDGAGKVTGITPGMAKITVKAEDGEFTAISVVTVTGIVESKSPVPDNNVALKLTDISEHWASPDITKAVGLGLVNGYPDGTFRPDAGITRAEFTSMLMKGLKQNDEGLPLSFRDNDEIGAWAIQPAAQAVQLGIISGYEDGTFRPNANITHAEMIAMVIRSSGLPAGKASKTNYADDADIPDWAKVAVSTAEETGIIIVGGITDKKFAPQVLSTRAEAASAIVRMLQVRK